MEYKAISFRTFQKYCKHKNDNGPLGCHYRMNRMCFDNRKRYYDSCKKRKCPIFKRLKTAFKHTTETRYWPYEHER